MNVRNLKQGSPNS